MTNRKIPLRKCTGCGEMKPKSELVRVILTPEGDIVIDKTGRQNGRGAYVCQSLECLEKAHKSKGLERSLKTSIPQNIYDKLKEEM
ncbi:MAG: YlxR family protein [Lachnospiraceae bacterium]|nr:YlxR family protein [Lachnospiraceae bacterium]MCR5083155.1 YlxR family protein [Parasporobacterium sp.]